MFKSGVIENVSAIGQKCSIKEEVDEIDLANDVDEIQYFASKKSHGIHWMGATVHPKNKEFNRTGKYTLFNL